LADLILVHFRFADLALKVWLELHFRIVRVLDRDRIKMHRGLVVHVLVTSSRELFIWLSRILRVKIMRPTFGIPVGTLLNSWQLLLDCSLAILLGHDSSISRWTPIGTLFRQGVFQSD